MGYLILLEMLAPILVLCLSFEKTPLDVFYIFWGAM